MLSLSYLVAGVPCVVSANAAVLGYIDETYGAYRVDGIDADPYSIQVRPEGAGFVLSDSHGRAYTVPDEDWAILETLRRLVYQITDELTLRGIYATHAGSLVYDGQALIIPGKSRAGKTTLTLALVSHGLGLLSDEFALSAPDARTILPYRRGLHIRPGTPELLSELAFLNERPPRALPHAEFQWTLPPRELEQAFPACLADAAPLRHVVLLEPRGTATTSVLEPVSKGVLAIEIVRSTTSAATDFDATMERVTQLIRDARCARLRPGRLESSIEVLLEWLDRDDD